MIADARGGQDGAPAVIAQHRHLGQTSCLLALLTCTWLALSSGWQRAIETSPACVGLWLTNALVASARLQGRSAQRALRATPRHRTTPRYPAWRRDDATRDQAKAVRNPAQRDIRRTGLCGKADPRRMVLPKPAPVRSPISPAGLAAKATLDQVIAAVAVVLLMPLLLTIALVIGLDSRGPVIFRQRRHGQGNCTFTVFKFRTMTQCASLRGDGGMQTRRGDCRVTRVGEFLRATSLDELPQLFNVLNGSMSLVGPRPHPIAMRTENWLGEEIIPHYAERHAVKPGITGWAQINGYRGATDTVEQLRRRVEHDLFYIKNWSLLLDLRILVLTPLRILFDRDNAF